METSLAENKRLYLKAKRAYFKKTDTLMSDAEFDKLEDLIREADPNWKELHKTGVKVNKKTDTPLLRFS